jgi:hypothetical protein
VKAELRWDQGQIDRMRTTSTSATTAASSDEDDQAVIGVEAIYRF